MTTIMHESIPTDGSRTQIYKAFLSTLNTGVMVGELLMKINWWFAEHIEYIKEPDGKDHWQSLGFTLEHGFGDCEDLAVAKWKTLKLLGINAALINLELSGQAHMVVKVGPLIMDESVVLAKDYMQHVRVAVKFDDNFLVVGTQVSEARKSMKQWDAVLTEMASEGFESMVA